MAGWVGWCGLEIIWKKRGRGLFDVLFRNLPGTERNISLYTSIVTQIQTRHFWNTIPKFYNYECRTKSTSIDLHNTSPIRQNYSTPKPQFEVKISPHTSMKLAWKFEERKNQLDATKWFLLNLWFVQHVSGTIMPIIRSSRLYRSTIRWNQLYSLEQMVPSYGTSPRLWLFAGLVPGRRLCVRVKGCCSKQHLSTQTHNLRPGTRPATSHSLGEGTIRWNHLYSLELLMMGIIVPETCWANSIKTIV
jgi:hypothetical protein